MALSKVISVIDEICTKYLRKGIIVNENSFTAIFTVKCFESNIKSVVLNKKLEGKLGCDAIALIYFKNSSGAYGYKIGLWEAKLAKGSWDRKGHFNNQIARQLRIGRCAVWEMIYNDGALSSDCNSVCILRDDIASSVIIYKNWTTKRILKLKKYFRKIEDIMEDITKCKIGTFMTREDLYLTIGDERIYIPLLENNNIEINNFMEKIGVNNYYYIEICDIEK